MRRCIRHKRADGAHQRGHQRKRCQGCEHRRWSTAECGRWVRANILPPVGGDCASIGTAALQVFANSSSSPHQRTVACRASSSLGARIAVPRDTGPVGILAPHMVVHGPHLSRRASHGVSTPTRGCVRLVPSPTSAHDLIHSNWTAAAQPTTARIIQCEPIAALQLFRRQAKGRGGRPRILPQWGCAPHVVPNHMPPRGAACAALAPSLLCCCSCGPSVRGAIYRFRLDWMGFADFRRDSQARCCVRGS